MHRIYPEDFFLLSRQIKLRRIDNYLTESAIVSVPHAEKSDFIDNLLRIRKFMIGEDPAPQIDRAGLESLKQQLGVSKTIKVRQAKYN